MVGAAWSCVEGAVRERVWTFLLTGAKPETNERIDKKRTRKDCFIVLFSNRVVFCDSLIRQSISLLNREVEKATVVGNETIASAVFFLRNRAEVAVVGGKQ